MEQKWIDAEKCMPDDYIEVLVYFENFRHGELYRSIGIGNTYDGRWLFVNGSTVWHQLKVIAWMPLPEPPTNI